MSNHNDVLIIGGGVIGACAAYYLSQQNASVTLIEKDYICAGSSHGNAGWVAAGHAIPLAAPGVLTQGLKWLLDPGSPFYIKPRMSLDLLRWLWQFQAACTQRQMLRGIPPLLALNRHGLALFDKLAAVDGFEFGYERKGLLHLYLKQSTLEKGLKEASLMREFGVETVALDHDGVRQMEPNVLDSVLAGIFYPDYAHLIPHQFVQTIAQAAQANGAMLHEKTEVIGFETAGERISTVKTTRGSFEADQVVLAAGAWCAPLARMLGIRLALQPAKGYSITVKRPPTCPHLPLALDEYKIAATPLGDIFRFSSTLELAGFDFSINPRRLAATRQGICDYLPGMADLEVLEIWRGYRPATPDGLPIIGRSHTIDNLIFATGHGMLGITHGPITGKLVAQIIANETPQINLTPLRAERF